MSDRRTQLDAGAVAVMIVLCASWGLSQVAIKVANPEVPPLLQAGLRSLGAAALVLAWAAWRRIRLFERDGTLPAGLAVALLFSGEFALVYGGLLFTTASRAVVLLYFSPFVVAAGAHVFIPGERLGRPQLLGLCCAFLGVLACFADALALPSRRALAGDAMEVAAAVAWGATTVVIKASRLGRADPAKTLLYQLAGSAALLLAASAAFGESARAGLDGMGLAALGYQIVWVAFFTYLLWFWLIGRYPAARLSAFSFLTPLFGVAAGSLLLGDPISPEFVGGLALVVFGILLVNRRAAPAPRGT